MSQKDLYLFANWKMYLGYDESNILANALASRAKKISPRVRLAIFPNALSLYPAGQVLRDVSIAVGAQNFYWLDRGGYTGEMSAAMFKEAGCQYALVGHSERRHVFNESNHDVRQKLEAALAAGLIPVLCVGETAGQRKKGETEEAVETQLRSALSKLRLNGKKEIFIAYEPVWAISSSGSGQACSPVEAERMQNYIAKLAKALLPTAKIKILYGGSVRETNVADFLSQPNCDGALVGHASTILKSWLGIIEAATSPRRGEAKAGKTRS